MINVIVGILIFIWSSLFWAQLIKVKGNKTLACVFGWHSFWKGFIEAPQDHVITYAQCKDCGFKGMLDGQGNIF